MNTTQATPSSSVRTRDIYSISNGESEIEKDEGEEEEEVVTPDVEDPRNIVIPVYRHLKIRIYKPLIPLKIALFLWYGGAAAVTTFHLVFFRQRGLSLSELSIILGITPVVQFIGPTISGIIADKIGRPKVVLIVILFLTILVVGGMIAAPHMDLENCEPQHVKLKCHREEFGRLVAKTSCDVHRDVIELAHCNVTCPENVTQYCSGQNLICEILDGDADSTNFSLSVHVSMAYKLGSRCYYNVHHMSHKNTTYSWCNVPHKMYCKINCHMDPEEGCSDDNNGRNWLLILNAVLLVLFNTFSSNTYRFLDVTAMILVKEHDSDFGRERFFGIMGVLVMTPVSGYLVDISSIDDEHKNYDMALYIFIGFIILLLPMVHILDIRIMPPGKNMWRKTVHMFKNPDVVSFILLLLTLGTCWGFVKHFVTLYLENMHAPSFLLGLMVSVNSLYGLPFLLTSNWWVKKIGTTNIFLLAFLGYIACGLGYSFIQDPWLAIIMEATSILTYHLLWVAVVVYSHSIAPDGLTSSVISVAGGIHYSIGRGFGALIFGSIMDVYGGRIAFRMTALVCLISSVLYALYLYVRRLCFRSNTALACRNGTENATFENDDIVKGSYDMIFYKS